MRKKSKLSPPHWRWDEDLPEPDEPPLVMPASWIERPNHLDDVFLELSRKGDAPRGVMIWLVLLTAFYVILMWAAAFSVRGGLRDLGPLLFLVTPLLLWITLSMWKTEVETPRDMPLRFNRARQRIYAYNFVHKAWNPFERWRVVPVSYEWSQVRAERMKRSTRVVSDEVFLSIVRPGTNEVIDRFRLVNRWNGVHTWDYVRAYMQQGPDALPRPGVPEDHNDVPWYNAALRLAPKVEWPADMDRESTTEP